MLFICIKSWFFRNHLAKFHQISHWSFCWNVIDSLFKWSCSIDCQAHIFFFKTKNCSNDDIFISCDDRIGKMLHNICMSAVAMSLRWANGGPWASCYVCFSAHLDSTGGFLLLQYSSGVVWQPRDLQMSQHIVSVVSSSLLHYRFYLLPVMIHGWVRRPPHRPNKCMFLPLLSICKSYSHFLVKFCELDIVLTRTVNILTTNELVKLTILRTTGPRTLWNEDDCSLWDCWLRDTKKLNWSAFKKFCVRPCQSLLPMWLFSDFYLMFLLQPSHKQTF